jgi:hypothetical protein
MAFERGVEVCRYGGGQESALADSALSKTRSIWARQVLPAASLTRITAEIMKLSDFRCTSALAKTRSIWVQEWMRFKWAGMTLRSREALRWKWQERNGMLGGWATVNDCEWLLLQLKMHGVDEHQCDLDVETDYFCDYIGFRSKSSNSGRSMATQHLPEAG